MTVYFTASIVGKKFFLKNYQAIIEILQSNNNKVISDHIIKSDEKKISLSTKEERLAFHKKLEDWINGSDFMIAETSFPSISVGYEISLALQRGKPVLILFSNSDPPSLLAFHQNEKLICERYTLETLTEIIEDFTKYIEGVNDTRFTFFITPQINAYLEKIAETQRIPKSVYLRNLIKKDMTSS